LAIDPKVFAGKRLHLHVPAGAVPKDDPSAGVTITTTLVSLPRGEPVLPIVGMTGNATLQGHVLPIGGVNQKVLTAHRAGLTDVILPERNGPNLEDVPGEVRRVMTFHLARTITDVLSQPHVIVAKQCLEPHPLLSIGRARKRIHHLIYVACGLQNFSIVEILSWISLDHHHWRTDAIGLPQTQAPLYLMASSANECSTRILSAAGWSSSK
jgi:hypothetical protein